MTEPYTHLAGAPLANILILAGLACIAMAIFGWASGTIAASANFRKMSGLVGMLLLFYVYGIYGHRAAATPREPARQADGEQSTKAQPPQEPAPWTMRPVAQNPAQSAQPPAQPTQPAAQSSQSAPGGLFSGKWKNANPNRASVVCLKVEQQGDQVSVRAWGLCASQYCDWGTGHGVVRGGSANVTWDQGSALRRMRLLPAAGSLRMVLDSTYKDRRPPQHREERFAKSL